MLEFLSAIRREPWKAVSAWHVGAFSLGCGALLLLLATDNDGVLFLIDHANLAFHEAGHLFYGILGPTLALYGGTLGQLTFPAVAGLAFWVRREPVGFAVAWVWFFQNFLNIAWYMADARAQRLPLVGGGDHDWANIFSRWGVLSLDTTIASAVQFLGWVGMITLWGWLAWRWASQPSAKPRDS
jgi:hypothetical protein